MSTIKEPMWGISAEADFESNRWTFRMVGDDYEVSAGSYALVYNDDWQCLVNRLERAERKWADAGKLLRRVQEEGVSEKVSDAVESFFDPEPL